VVGKSVDFLRVDTVNTAEPIGEQTGDDGSVRSVRSRETILATVLAEVTGVERVSVDGDFFADLGADSMVMARFCARLRKRPDIPSVSMRDIYEHRTIRALAAALPAVGPPPLETTFAAVLAEVTGVEQVSVDGDFFADLGADSMVMARFCARLRKRPDIPSVSMRDIYEHRTIRALVATIAAEAPQGPDAGAGEPEAPAPVSQPRYLLCGVLQCLVFVGYSAIAGWVGAIGYDWIAAGNGLLEIYLRSVEFGGAAFLGVCLFPILVKWVLVGRWRPNRRIRLWSLAYLRFWAAKVLVQANPMVLFVGSPVFVLYLRALGAKIGPGVSIFSKHVPVCADLLTIGAGTVIRKDSFFACYRAQAGVIQTGAVTLGRDVLVGEGTVLDIGTVMGDGAQIGHASSLQGCQAIPAGESWNGSPARRCTVDYRLAEPARCGTARRFTFGLSQMLVAVLLYAPVAVGGLFAVLTKFPRFDALTLSAPHAVTDWTFYLDALVTSFVLFFGAVLVGLVGATILPRLMNSMLKPDRVYPLYGFHYTLYRAITRITITKFFGPKLFGDSSFIVGYLRALGYRLTPVTQTGSNFGTEVAHDTPFLSSVGTGTMIADGLSVVNGDYSSTSFRLRRATIGPHNFLGNQIRYPAGARTGDNCLLATKVMVPLEGEVREGVGLLGSPSFEIPRSVERDRRFDYLKEGPELRRRLAAKNRHNIGSMMWYLLARWGYLFGLALALTAATELYDRWGAAAFAVTNVALLVFSTAYWVLVDRIVTTCLPVRPKFCSIYQRPFWRQERYWKVPAEIYLTVFNGTPFKGLLWRLLGARVGKRLFDDGLYMTERTLVTVGDDCVFNAGSRLQCHSQEDGTFKSDTTTIGNGCTLGVSAFVHYGVTVGDHTVLLPDSFLMKGEQLPSRSRWGGNPASEMPANLGVVPAVAQR
jgi:non-ribosomal peptide synthetase-like protein